MDGKTASSNRPTLLTNQLHMEKYLAFGGYLHCQYLGVGWGDPSHQILRHTGVSYISEDLRGFGGQIKEEARDSLTVKYPMKLKN